MKNTTKPTHRANIVRNYTDVNGVEKSHWTQIGSVWTHKDGEGFDVVLTALPLDGRIVIRLDEPKPVEQPKPVDAASDEVIA